MQISGLEKCSFVDYPGFISCVIFIQGCNFKCSYCHNKQLWEKKDGDINKEEVFDFLRKRINMIEGIVVSGGEPTCREGLLEFIEELKQFNLPIKLDTNGSNPEVLKEVLPHIDYVAMDIKTSLEQDKYSKVCSVDINIEDIKKSIDLIINSTIPYLFRTTYDKDLITEEDKKQIEIEMKDKVHIFQTKR